MYTPPPYNGKDKYIFISYSHRDTQQVFPIIAKLMEKGYRVWYDAGIDPGTEWDENIAQHINDCGYFIAFMSSNYLGSNNCKDELNYARDLEKERLLVYLEEVQLPAGMAMRVNRLQSIFKFTYANDADFYGKLFAAKNIETCLGGETKTAPVKSEKPQTPPPVQPVRPQTPPPVQSERPQTPPPVQSERPQTPPPVQSERPQTPPPVQPVRPQAAVLKAKEKANKGARIASAISIVLCVMAANESTLSTSALGMLYCSMIAGAIALSMEKAKGFRVMITIVYFISVAMVWTIFDYRIYWGVEQDEYMKFMMPIIWIVVYYFVRRASLKKIQKG